MLIAERYPSPQIAQRRLEQMTNALLLTSSPGHDEATTGAGGPMATDVVDGLVGLAEEAYRVLIWDNPKKFEAGWSAPRRSRRSAAWRAAPRPARRAAASAPSLETVPAIPGVFAWAQSRTNLPAWYGVGAALAGYAFGPRRRRARGELAEAYRRTGPYFKLDHRRRSARPGNRRSDRGRALCRPGRRLETEVVRVGDTMRVPSGARRGGELLGLTGSAHLLDAQPAAARGAASSCARQPYVDVLSKLQVRGLAQAAQEWSLGGEERATAERLLQVTVSGLTGRSPAPPVEPIRHHGAAMARCRPKTAIVTRAAADMAAPRPSTSSLTAGVSSESIGPTSAPEGVDLGRRPNCGGTAILASAVERVEWSRWARLCARRAFRRPARGRAASTGTR